MALGDNPAIVRYSCIIWMNAPQNSRHILYSAKEEKPSLRWSSYVEIISDSVSSIRAKPYTSMFRKAAINMHLFIYFILF